MPEAVAEQAQVESTPPLFKRLVAEAIGTGIIVGGGCGSVCSAMYLPGYALGPLGISLAFGGSVALAVYATRDISGAHLNPAITAMLAVNRPDSISYSEAACYMGAQVTGAALAAVRCSCFGSLRLCHRYFWRCIDIFSVEALA